MNKSGSSNSLIALIGGNGVGKTRLLMEIERQLSVNLVERLGAESLVDELVASLRRGLEHGPPLEHFAKIDTLLIDNLWVLAGRPGAAGCIGGLLKERQKKGRLTIVASELAVEQWAEKQPVIAELLKGSVRIQLS